MNAVHRIALLCIALTVAAAPQLIAGTQQGPGTALVGGSTRVVELPSGSNDALAAAIAKAGPHGAVFLRKGLHTESKGVIVNIPVRIVGEPGAVLEVDTCPDPRRVFQLNVDPALHVLGARNVMIWGLEIRPTTKHKGACAGQFDGIGGCAILLENASQAIIGRNVIHGHQMGVVLHHGDHALIHENTITGVFPKIFFCAGVLVLNGGFVQIKSNEVAAMTAGIFTGDVGGKALFNRCHGNLMGFVL